MGERKRTVRTNGFGVGVDVGDVLDFGFEEEERGGEVRAEGVDDVFEEATQASMLMRDGIRPSEKKRKGSDYGEKSSWKCCIVT